MSDQSQSSLSFFPETPQEPITDEIQLIMDNFFKLSLEEQKKLFKKIHSRKYADINQLLAIFAEVLTMHMEELAMLVGEKFENYTTDYIKLTIRVIRIWRCLQKSLRQQPDGTFVLNDPLIE